MRNFQERVQCNQREIIESLQERIIVKLKSPSSLANVEEILHLSKSIEASIQGMITLLSFSDILPKE